jgi:nucleoside-diphosphate-sugar epimerase
MAPTPQLRLTREMTLRIVADTLLINIAVLVALAVRFFYHVGFEGELAGAEYNRIFWKYVAAFYESAWLLTLISLIIFYMSGFYTYGRAYTGRFKALVVAQAISLAYVLFGFLSFFLGGSLHLPRGAWILAWILSLVLLMSARLWSLLWADVIQADRHLRSQRNRSRKILVIGGAGYIGSALLPKLLDKGYHVRLLDLLLYGPQPIQDWIDHPRLEILKADFRHVNAVVEAMRDVDAVIHLGGIVGDPACALDEELTIEINLMATRMIADVVRSSNVSRFIFASSCSVYGASDEILDEHSALNPISLYARSKIASEKVLMRMASASFAPTILRFATIYGFSGRTRFDLVINLLTAKAVVEGQITIDGGDQWRPFLHVDDAAQALLKTLEAPLSVVGNEVLNVGSDEQNYTIQQAAEIIHSMVPTAQLTNMGADANARNYRVSFNKVREVLDFSPRWTLKQGVQQVIQALRGHQVQDYRDAKYSNVKFLNEGRTVGLLQPENGWAYNLINESPDHSFSRRVAKADRRGRSAREPETSMDQLAASTAQPGA